ncbi:MAG: hypothetical protein HQK79_22225 [Desulfobacterales bacterium]|nr:hypothetical protein [Desulfobacterales bacterium]
MNKCSTFVEHSYKKIREDNIRKDINDQNASKNIPSPPSQLEKKEGLNGKKIKFDQFWNAYPKKIAKQAALKSFLKINPDDQMLAAILTTIEKFKQTEDWKKEKGQFVPHPTTWLNQGRWEDEIDICQPPPLPRKYQEPSIEELIS